MRFHLIHRRMAWGALLGAGYGLWTVRAHLPQDLDWTTWLGSAAWSLAALMAGGSILAGLVAAVALVAGWAASPANRPRLAAAIETCIWLPVILWLVLNEFVYSLTSEVVGVGALQLLWHDTRAVVQNSWAMGAKYLVATGAIVLAVCVLVAWGSLKSWRRHVREKFVQGEARSAGAGRPRRWIGVFVACPILLTVLLAWEACRQPSDELIVACRSVPAIRVFNLVQILSCEKLRRPAPKHFGPPVVTEAQYVRLIAEQTRTNKSAHAASSTQSSPRTPAPNVVFLLLESTPAGALHCYGNPRPDVSPNLDRLAAEGVRFDHCVAPSSFSSCSVVSVATSLYMMRSSGFDYFADITFPFMTFPRALKLAGYELTLFSSGNEAFDNINHFCKLGDFDVYLSLDTYPVQQPDCMRMDDHVAVEAFEKWLGKRNDPRPFYSGFYLQSPHFNYEIPEPWASYYQPVPPMYSNGSGILKIPPDVLPKLKNQHANAIRYMDSWVGRIVSDLDKAGVLGRTIIVATGDHGEAFMEHGLARHGVHTWEEMIHTPLIVWAGSDIRSALPAGKPPVVADTVSGLDIAPTLAGLVGIAPYPGWQGVNALAPGYSDRDRPVFSMTQYTRWQETVCVDRIKYTYDLTDAVEYLFDLRCDPGERDNLAGRNPALAAAMRSLLAGWHTRQLAYYSVPNRPEYVGEYVPDAELLEAVHRAAGTRSR